ncbi:MAG TPA: hypothetical protein VFQ22_14040 [Longimicrobiales bacterium]|nr:hypothetical protein [Longimicrobiales bacterium]
MVSRLFGRMVAIVLLMVGTGTAAQAQLGDLSVTGQIGAAIPVAQLADYTDPGMSFGLRVAYPISGVLDFVVDGEVDALQGRSAVDMPDMTLWRYRAGVETEVLGRSADNWGLRAHLGAGGTTFRSSEFYLDRPLQPERFKGTYFTGTGGLELVFGEGPVAAQLGAFVHWTPMDEDDTELLERRAPGRVERLETAFTVPLRFGLRILT